jgi:hypothetical protein
MWEFPHDQVGVKEKNQTAARRVAKDLVGLSVRLGGEIVTVRHSVTRFRIILTCFEASFRAGKFQSKFYHKGRWLFPARLQTLPVSSPQRRLALALVDLPVPVSNAD